MLIKKMENSNFQDLKKYGPTNREEECWVCKFSNRRSIQHIHYSSKDHHVNLESSGEITVKCSSCKITHPICEPNKRLKILITSEILPITLSTHNPPFHVNIEMVWNANLKELQENWENLYLSETTPMDVVVLSGHLEIPLIEISEFVEQIANLKRKVRKQNLENSFTFCELIRPPKYVRFPYAGVMPENFVNYLHKINSINRVIKTFNNATSKINSLSFASRGTRSKGTKRDSEGNLVYTSHKLSDWLSLIHI